MLSYHFDGRASMTGTHDGQGTGRKFQEAGIGLQILQKGIIQKTIES